MKYTLSILKPDAVQKNLTEKINEYITNSGLEIINTKTLLLSEKEASAFYEVHKDRPFFADLITFMTSGPVVVQVLSGDDAVNKYRKVMGDTDPKKADKGTIRSDFAENIDANCTHGSDSEENAEREIAFFFAQHEMI